MVLATFTWRDLPGHLPTFPGLRRQARQACPSFAVSPDELFVGLFMPLPRRTLVLVVEVLMPFDLDEGRVKFRPFFLQPSSAAFCMD